MTSNSTAPIRPVSLFRSLSRELVATNADITEVMKSQRNRRRQRRLQIFQKNFTFKASKINVK